MAAALLGLAALGRPAVAQPWFTSVTGLPGTEVAVDAEWHLPGDAGSGGVAADSLVVLQHGFGRRCANLRTLAAALAAAGHATVCLNADVARGNPVLAQAWARRLLQRPEPAPGGEGPSDAIARPDGLPLPARLVVAGHSVGGHFAAIAGETIALEAPQRLAGVLLLDPVAASAHFASALAAISDAGRRPVLALLAEPSGCNAQGNARPSLLAVQARARASGYSGEVGVTVEGGTHGDAEGPDTDRLASWTCGVPQPVAVAAVRTLAVRWIAAMVGASADRPVGAAIGDTVSTLTATTRPIAP
jgi:hypothetical protein